MTDWRPLIEAAPDLDTLHEIERAMALEAVATSPLTFAQQVSQATAEPWIPYRHLRLLNDQVMALIDGDSPTRRLIVLMPPRHGKSEFCSKYLPAWYLCRYPERRIILTSYEAEFARQWGRKVRNLLVDHQGLLPVRIKSDSKAADRFDLVGHNGGMQTAGAGGPITGKGAHLLVIDDPIKNAEQAYSQTERDNLWDWWVTTASTRLEPGGVVVFIQTRWHEDDLAGRLIDQDENRGTWEVLSLPAIAERDDPLGREVGEPLCPERYPLDGPDGLLEKREAMTVGPWSALYQQRPQPEGGGRFRKSTFKYWTRDDIGYRLKEPDGNLLIRREDCWRFITVDPAITEKTSGDFTVAAVWDVAPLPEPSKLILIDVTRERVVGPDHLPLLQRLYEQFKPIFIGVERATFGIGIIQAAIRSGLPIRELVPDKDKWARSEQAAVMCENGRVYWPQHAGWLAEWERELLAFPAAPHDDQVDAFAYAALEVFRGVNLLRRKKRAEPATFSERAWRFLENRTKGQRDHPVLGRV